MCFQRMGTSSFPQQIQCRIQLNPCIPQEKALGGVFNSISKQWKEGKMENPPITSTPCTSSHVPQHSSFLPCQSCPLPRDWPWEDKKPKPGWKWSEQHWVKVLPHCSAHAAPESTSAELPLGKILEPVMAKNTWREG